MKDHALINTQQLTHHTCMLAYEAPYAWSPLVSFYRAHPVPAQEWLGDVSLGRTFELDGAHGYFTARLESESSCFSVDLALDQPDKIETVLARIRHMLDLDSAPSQIEHHLHTQYPHLPLVSGLRIPRLWTTFEAGIRAILGQQISVGAASKLVNTLILAEGCPIDTPLGQRFIFPTVEALLHADLSVLPMVNARRDTLKRFVTWYSEAGAHANEPEQWLALKGIGPWTVNSAAMRGRGDTDMWLGGDLGIRKVMESLEEESPIIPENASPWRSYLTQQLWCLPTAWAPSRRRRS